MTSASFARLATVTASTKRATMVSGKKGAPTTYIASLSCTPIDPANEEIQNRFKVATPFEMMQTFTEGSLDIEPGDRLVVGSQEYDIRAVGDWTWSDTTYRHLILEKLRAGA